MGVIGSASAVRSRFLRLAYRLRRHEIGGWPIDRVLVVGLLAIGVLAALGWIPGRWTVVGLAAALLLALLVWLWWARRRGYIEFIPAIEAPPDGAPLLPTDKVPVRASGYFEVEGRRQFFVDLQAYFRTFATREHAIMAIVHISRWGGVATWPERELGMWYIFFLPQRIQGLSPGVIVQGQRWRPALHVRYQGEKQAEDVFLSFDNEEDRRLVWSDLRHDWRA